jgi:hypothetical protein
MSKVFIEEETLTALGNAVRNVVGSHTKEKITGTVDYKRISKTPNLDEKGRGSMAAQVVATTPFYDEITIPGATSLTINLCYQGGNAYSELYYQGVPRDEFSSYTATKLSLGSSSSTKTITLSDTDTVTFYYKPGTSKREYGYGYYAIVTGKDSDGNLIQEVRDDVEGEDVVKKFTLQEMINLLNNRPYYPNVYIEGEGPSGNGGSFHFFEIDVKDIHTLNFTYLIEFSESSSNKSSATIAAYYNYYIGTGQQGSMSYFDPVPTPNLSKKTETICSTGSVYNQRIQKDVSLDVTDYETIVFNLSIPKSSVDAGYCRISMINFRGE